MKSDYASVLEACLIRKAALQVSYQRMAENRRLLEQDLAHLVARTEDSINHRRGLLARIEDCLATEVGPLTLYRIYLLDEQGSILIRKDIHARSNADAVNAGWLWVDAGNRDRPDAARGVEVWRGRRLVFSSRHRVRAGRVSIAVAADAET
jgi:hypothetical protein